MPRDIESLNVHKKAVIKKIYISYPECAMRLFSNERKFTCGMPQSCSFFVVITNCNCLLGQGIIKYINFQIKIAVCGV